MSALNELPISIPAEALADFCAGHGVARLSLFGSILHNDFAADSDIDLLIEFLPGRGVGLIEFARMEIELSDLLGRRVDLNTPGFLSRHFADDVRREALPVYVAA